MPLELAHAHFNDQLCWTFVEANHWTPGIGLFGIKVEHILHTGDISAVRTSGMHHILRSHGFRSSSARRRRTVSRDSPSCSVNWTI